MKLIMGKFQANEINISSQSTYLDYAGGQNQTV